jgi:uncharacterized RDD family membrane protein YckC
VTARGDAPHAEGTLVLPTPEGVELQFAIARAGDRAAAFLVDVTIIFVALVLLLLLGWGSGVAWDGWLRAVFTLAAFLLINFYFIWFESRGRGTTPGKLRSGLRVMQADGTPLTLNAVVVRNVMRNIEVLLPLVVLLAPETFWPGAPGLLALLATLWLLGLMLMPLFNRHHLRVGDMVAGTVVVLQPQAILLADLGRAKVGDTRHTPEAAFTFSAAQLDVYGEYELQVLEDVLRRKTSERKVIGAVAQRIARKIGWSERVPARGQRQFLLDFYTALRAHLEKKMLFGKRKQNKHSGD